MFSFQNLGILKTVLLQTESNFLDIFQVNSNYLLYSLRQTGLEATSAWQPKKD